MVFVFGFGGFLANWAGLVTEETNPNLYFFQLFSDGEMYLNSVTGLFNSSTISIVIEYHTCSHYIRTTLHEMVLIYVQGYLHF